MATPRPNRRDAFAADSPFVIRKALAEKALNLQTPGVSSPSKQTGVKNASPATQSPRSLSGGDYAQLQAIFDQVDVDHNGILDQQEMTAFLHNIGQDNENLVNAIYEQLHATGDDGLTFEGFVKAFGSFFMDKILAVPKPKPMALLAVQQQSPSDKAKLRNRRKSRQSIGGVVASKLYPRMVELFHSVDSDEDGVVTAEALTKGLAEASGDEPPEEIVELINELDADRDGGGVNLSGFLGGVSRLLRGSTDNVTRRMRRRSGFQDPRASPNASMNGSMNGSFNVRASKEAELEVQLARQVLAARLDSIRAVWDGYTRVDEPEQVEIEQLRPLMTELVGDLTREQMRELSKILDPENSGLVTYKSLLVYLAMNEKEEELDASTAAPGTVDESVAGEIGGSFYIENTLARKNELKRENEKLLTRLEHLESDNRALRDASEHSDMEIARLKELVTRLEHDLTHTRRDSDLVDDLEKEKYELVNQVSSYAARVMELENTLERCQRELNQARAANRESTESTSHLKDEIETLTDENARLTAQLTEMEECHTGQIDSITESYEEEVNTLKRQAKVLKSKNGSLEDALKDAATELQDALDKKGADDLAAKLAVEVMEERVARAEMAVRLAESRRDMALRDAARARDETLQYQTQTQLEAARVRHARSFLEDCIAQWRN